MGTVLAGLPHLAMRWAAHLITNFTSVSLHRAALVLLELAHLERSIELPARSIKVPV